MNKLAKFRIKNSPVNNRVSSARIKQEFEINYCRYLATMQLASFKKRYEFSPNAMFELQRFLDSQFARMPYGWSLKEIGDGIKHMIETFIADRKVPYYRYEHISI